MRQEDNCIEHHSIVCARKWAGFQRRILLEAMLVAAAFYFGNLTGFLSSEWFDCRVKGFPEEKRGDDDILAGVSFSELKDALMSRYGSSNPNETNDYVMAKDAMQAMMFVEQDGNPIPILNHPYLYVGSSGAAYNRDALLKANITHIINVSGATRLKYPEHFTYMHIKSVKDTPNDRIAPYFKITSDFIETARLEGGRVMVHCWRGKSRSVSIVLAYLIRYHGMSPAEAMTLVQATRPDANPNDGFIMQLNEYSKLLRDQD